MAKDKKHSRKRKQRTGEGQPADATAAEDDSTVDMSKTLSSQPDAPETDDAPPSNSAKVESVKIFSRRRIPETC